MERYNMTLKQLEEKMTQQTAKMVGMKTQLYSAVQDVVRREFGYGVVEGDYFMDGKTFYIRRYTNNQDIRNRPVICKVEVSCKKTNEKNNIIPNYDYYNRKDRYKITEIILTPVHGKSTDDSVQSIVDFIDGLLAERKNIKEEQRKRNIAQMNRLMKEGELGAMFRLYESLDYETKKILKEWEN
jgi:hypothetical protein